MFEVGDKIEFTKSYSLDMSHDAKIYIEKGSVGEVKEESNYVTLHIPLLNLTIDLTKTEAIEYLSLSN